MSADLIHGVVIIAVVYNDHFIIRRVSLSWDSDNGPRVGFGVKNMFVTVFCFSAVGIFLAVFYYDHFGMCIDVVFKQVDQLSIACDVTGKCDIIIFILSIAFVTLTIFYVRV